MSYYIKDSSTSLDDLTARLEMTDLIPSHQPLLNGLTKNIDAIKKTGVQSIADLRARLKSKKSLASLADETALDSDYLVLLRRAIEGFFPKPHPLKLFDWLDDRTLAKLEQLGIKNTLHLYEIASSDANGFAKKIGLKEKEISELIALSDLSRVQWVSPTFARTLIASNVTSANEVSEADPATLYDAVMEANKNARFYKGKVGLRDIKRLIAAASCVP